MKNDKRRKRNISSKGYATRFEPVDLEPPKIYSDNGEVKRKTGRVKSSNQNRRRQNKKRRLKNSVRKALLSICLLLALLAVGATLSLTVFFKTQEVTISGSGIYSSDEIKNASTIDIGENLFLINSQDVEKELTKSLPYIYSVKVKKKLPSTVELTVTDAVVSYYYQNSDKTYILLDDNFKVLESNAAQIPAGCIAITDTAVKTAKAGETIVFEDEKISENLNLLAQAVKSTGMTEATAISSVDSSHNYIVYDGRITFELGECSDLENKIYRGLAACDQLNNSSSNIRGKMNLTIDKQSYFTAE